MRYTTPCSDEQSCARAMANLGRFFKALDLLHSCAQGNEPSIGRVNDLLARTKSLHDSVGRQPQRPETTSPPAPKSKSKCRRTSGTTESGAKENKEHTERRQQHAILSRPRPHVSGIRRVPVLVDARGVPFLRTKKPEPAVLSRTINSKLRKMSERIARRQRLEEELVMASYEDQWDHRTGHVELTKWTISLNTALTDVKRTIDYKTKENRELSYKMFNVVLQERKLAKKEEDERERLRMVAASGEDGTDSTDVFPSLS